MNTKIITAALVYILYSTFVYLMIGFSKMDLNVYNFSHTERVVMIIFGFCTGLLFAISAHENGKDFFKKGS